MRNGNPITKTWMIIDGPLHWYACMHPHVRLQQKPSNPSRLGTKIYETPEKMEISVSV